MRLPRFVQVGAAAFGTCAALVITRDAFAVGSVTLRAGATVTREVVTHNTDTTKYNWISRSDCLSTSPEDVFHFPLTITEGAGFQLEVWVGQGSTDCNANLARTTAPQCLRVYSAPVITTVFDANIKSRDIALIEKGSFAVLDVQNKGISDATACDKVGGATAGDQVTVFFMLIDSGSPVSPAYTWSTKIDLVGPSPPTNIQLGVGSTLLKPQWDPNLDPDVAGYTFFCDPPPGGPRDAGSPGLICDDASGGGTPTDDAATGADGGDDASADGAIGPVPPALALSRACVPPVVTTCGDAGAGSTFGAGLAPSPELLAYYQCASSNDRTSTQTTIKGLTNGVPVAVAVAAIDFVQNVGPLSTSLCGMPELVNGFDELYHQDGGTAGGGFCSFSHLAKKRDGAYVGGLSFMVLAIWAQRRRSRTVPK